MKRRRSFALRLTGVIAAVAGAAGCIIFLAWNAAVVGRAQLDLLARTELEADDLAREFSQTVDDLHSTLLTVGEAPAGSINTEINRLEGALDLWVRQRQAAARSDDERQLLGVLARELAAHFQQVAARTAARDGTIAPLSSAEVRAFDDTSVRLQSLADDFASLHTERLKDVLAGSLSSMRRLRNLNLLSLGLLMAAGLALGYVFYRDLVRPLQLLVVDREQALARGEKLAALGTLAAGVAHEIRNPLTAMKARLFALRRAHVDTVVRDDLTAIQHDVERLEHIVRDVLDFARPAKLELAEVDLAAWAREFAAFLQPEMEAAGITVIATAAEPVVAPVDAGRLRQVALNLVRNSREAFEGRPGRIELAVRRGDAVARGRASPAAILAVTDNGPGIPPEVRERLFDPFFTTKASGTGLGLAIVARIVEAHAGAIALRTRPEGGTCFEIRLPLASPPPRARD